MAQKEALPAGCQWYPQKRYAVLPTPLYRSPLDPSFYTSSSSLNQSGGTLVAPLDPTKPFVVYHKDFLKLLGPAPSLDLIASSEVKEGGDGYSLFHEAGIWVDETEEVFFTSNCNPQFNNLIGRIRLDALSSPQARTLTSSWDILTPIPSTNAQASVIATNGGTLYRVSEKDKLLLCCQGTHEIPSNLSVVDPQTGESYCILNNYGGRPFNAINDVVVLPPPGRVGEDHPRTDRTDLHDHQLTTIWFTDPTYASAQGYKGPPQLPCQVYCFTPATGDVRVVADGFSMPNGLCFSPCTTLCYITDTGMLPGDGSIEPQRPGTIYVYDVVRPKQGEKDAFGQEADLTAVQPRLENRRVFAFCDSGIPDGIKTDKQGNVYSGTGEGVSVWNSTGTLLGKIILFPLSGLPNSLPTTDPESKVRYCANFNFCPKGNMCVLAEDRVYKVQLAAGVEGALLP